MADISKIKTPDGSSYDLKDGAAVASITATSTGNLSYTMRDGSQTEIEGLASPIVITVDGNTMYITSTGTSLAVAVNDTVTALSFTVVA